MLFGPLPPVCPAIYLRTRAICIVSEYTYVGTTFSSTSRYIFAHHYSHKAKVARQVANAALGLESMIGDLPPEDGKRLYMARIDPHLTFACEVALDIDPTLLQPLVHIQQTYLRRLLGLNSRCQLLVLFSETGILPLKYRRAMLALRYLRHLLILPTDDLAAIALAQAHQLAVNGFPSWVSDLHVVLQRMETPVGFDLHHPLTLRCVDDCLHKLTASLEGYVQRELNDSPRLLLLRQRTELTNDGRHVHHTLAFRHYLRVTCAEHRKALTRLLVSDHALAVEQLRRAERGRATVPREWRICRLCRHRDIIEDPVHALFECTSHPDLVSLRDTFLNTVFAERTNLRTAYNTLSRLAFTRELIAQEHSIALLAKFAHDVLQIFTRENLIVVSSREELERFPTSLMHP
ncbi:hypothetical protein SCP_0407740 [Sparassis crispa]|uniref:Reverse transcriptase domain-containing protein n=1 Tax=Sparassis crispa TaxID=139825 RepID=A0A401GJQ4_9APHY|nr:hypothetical protein SCP_0407740 [Sparassis crispa]GBE82390.1 hypothetical protein SCP_0407740 [Sparassis crispa]